MSLLSSFPPTQPPLSLLSSFPPTLIAKPAESTPENNSDVGTSTPQQQEKGVLLAKMFLQNGNLSSEDTDDLYNRVLSISQSIHDNNHAIAINDKTLTGHTIFVVKTGFHLVTKAAGQGGQSKTYFTRFVTLDGKSPKHLLVKVSPLSFESDKNYLKNLSPPSKKSPWIDHLIENYTVQNRHETYLGVFEPSACDFDHVDYAQVKQPAQFMTEQLIGVTKAIASFHRADVILRDIKGANCLINYQGEGKLTDWGLLMPQNLSITRHSTPHTPTHSAPYIWKNILGQKYFNLDMEPNQSGGWQTKASDLFSLGRTIQLDILAPMISYLAKKYRIPFQPYIDFVIRPKILTDNFSDEDLLKLDEQYKGRFFCYGLSNSGYKFAIFEKRETVLSETVKMLDELKKNIPESEYKIMRALASLAFELQNPSKKGLLEYLNCPDDEHHSDALINVILKELENLGKIHSSTYCRKIDFKDFEKSASTEAHTPIKNKRPSSFNQSYSSKEGITKKQKKIDPFAAISPL